MYQRTIWLISFISIVIVPVALIAQAKRPQDAQASCRNAAQNFYDWYVPIAKVDTSPRPNWDAAIKERSQAFSSELLRLLKDDMEAWDKTEPGGYIVSLDIDPFLITQNPADNYTLGNINVKGGTCWVELYGIVAGKKNGEPDVVRARDQARETSVPALFDGDGGAVGGTHCRKGLGSDAVAINTVIAKILRSLAVVPPVE